MFNFANKCFFLIVGSIFLIVTGCAYHEVRPDAAIDHAKSYENTRQQQGWLLVENHPDEIHYKVLLLPGFLCTDLVYSDLLNNQNLSQKGVKLIAANPPGFKGMPTEKGFNYSVESYAKAIESLDKTESFDLIIGHSFFGNVLIEVAARKVYSGKLMLLSPSLYRDAEGIDTRAMDRIGHIPGVGTFTMWVSYQMMESFFKPYMTEEKHARIKPMVEEAKKTSPDVARLLLMSFFDYIDRYGDLTERLTSSNITVWYVRGDQDNIKLSQETRSRLIKSPYIVMRDIPGSKHFIMIDKPSEISDLILEILSGRQTSRREIPSSYLSLDLHLHNMGIEYKKIGCQYDQN